jgi:hypothetical protein
MNGTVAATVRWPGRWACWYLRSVSVGHSLCPTIIGRKSSLDFSAKFCIIGVPYYEIRPRIFSGS